MRRLAISVTATVLALLALLGFKAARGNNTASNSAAADVAKVNNAGNAVVVTGPEEVLAHGIVQVRATLVGGRITDVTALSLPHDNPHSFAGSSAAAVKLRSEVLSKQSADVSIVSGATYTSHGYISSLQAALDAAGHH